MQKKSINELTVKVTLADDKKYSENQDSNNTYIYEE